MKKVKPEWSLTHQLGIFNTPWFSLKANPLNSTAKSNGMPYHQFRTVLKCDPRMQAHVHPCFFSLFAWFSAVCVLRYDDDIKSLTNSTGLSRSEWHIHAHWSSKYICNGSLTLVRMISSSDGSAGSAASELALAAHIQQPRTTLWHKHKHTGERNTINKTHIQSWENNTISYVHVDCHLITSSYGILLNT